MGGKVPGVKLPSLCLLNRCQKERLNRGSEGGKLLAGFYEVAPKSSTSPSTLRETTQKCSWYHIVHHYQWKAFLEVQIGRNLHVLVHWPARCSPCPGSCCIARASGSGGSCILQIQEEPRNLRNWYSSLLKVDVFRLTTTDRGFLLDVCSERVAATWFPTLSMVSCILRAASMNFKSPYTFIVTSLTVESAG